MVGERFTLSVCIELFIRVKLLLKVEWCGSDKLRGLHSKCDFEGNKEEEGGCTLADTSPVAGDALAHFFLPDFECRPRGVACSCVMLLPGPPAQILSDTVRMSPPVEGFHFL